LLWKVDFSRLVGSLIPREEGERFRVRKAFVEFFGESRVIGSSFRGDKGGSASTSSRSKSSAGARGFVFGVWSKVIRRQSVGMC